MTTLNLPNEIIDKIFSYIQGNNNQIIKKELIHINSFWGDRNRDISMRNIKYAFDIIKRNLIPTKMLYDKYFKYTLLHKRRKNLLNHIKFWLKNIINKFNYRNNSYTKILQQVRENYISNYSEKYELTNRQLRKYYNVYFKYTILHENHKKVCNHIERYNTNKRYIVNKKLFKYILLERGIVINYNQKDKK
jgi:hypothetical protein